MRLSSRVWSGDHTVWSPTIVPELVDRLGWLTLPETMEEPAREFLAFADEVRAEGTRHVVLLGMGGSSLAPEVFQATFGRREGYPGLTVLDSTHPDAVRSVEAGIELGRTLFVVSSKSGGDERDNILLQVFLGQVCPRARPAATSSPSPTRGRPSRRWRATGASGRSSTAQPDVGGRYSALTAFGLVPAALVGVKVPHLLEHVRAMSGASGPAVEGEQNPSVALGVALGDMALAGRDKLTFLVEPVGGCPAGLD